MHTIDKLTIDKVKFCEDVTPRLIDDLVGAVWAAESDGWTNEKWAIELQNKIEKIGSYCDIIKSPGIIRTYTIRKWYTYNILKIVN